MTKTSRLGSVSLVSKRRIVPESDEEAQRLLRFVLLRTFERNWRQLGFTEVELAALEITIMAAPEAPEREGCGRSASHQTAAAKVVPSACATPTFRSTASFFW